MFAEEALMQAWCWLEFGILKEDHDAFNRLAADPEIAPHVHELGQRTDVPEIIPALDVFLVMSKIEEAPVAPLEAMSREIPVVSYDVGNMAEITSPELLVAQGDEAGFLAAAERLARDRAVRKTAGRWRVRPFALGLPRQLCCRKSRQHIATP
jgi:glycosyltransferase involved in cell wall biosynthesis